MFTPECKQKCNRVEDMDDKTPFLSSAKGATINIGELTTVKRRLLLLLIDGEMRKEQLGQKIS